jgi:hypothetical protein
MRSNRVPSIDLHAIMNLVSAGNASAKPHRHIDMWRCTTPAVASARSSLDGLVSRALGLEKAGRRSVDMCAAIAALEARSRVVAVVDAESPDYQHRFAHVPPAIVRHLLESSPDQPCVAVEVFDTPVDALLAALYPPWLLVEARERAELRRKVVSILRAFHGAEAFAVIDDGDPRKLFGVAFDLHVLNVGEQPVGRRIIHRASSAERPTLAFVSNVGLLRTSEADASLLLLPNSSCRAAALLGAVHAISG